MRNIIRYIRSLFEDKDKNVVLAQKPNLPIISWVLFTLIAIVLPEGRPQLAVELIAFGSIFTWAWLELFQGVNTFRRILGAIVLIFIIFSRMLY